MNYIKRNFLIGFSDGLMIPFALATGLYSAGVPFHIILIAVGIQICAGALTMGLSSYHTTKEALNDVQENDVIHSIGLTNDIENEIEKDQIAEQEVWMSNFKNDEKETPATSASIIGLSYFAGGLIPLLPYLFIKNETAFITSITITILTLIVVGYSKAPLWGTKGWMGAIRLTFFGALIAGAAYFISRIFNES